MTKKRILPPDRMAECEAAHGLFLAKKNELKLSQKKVADAAGMTPAAVNLYFKGINPLNAKFASTLAKLLHVPVREFSPRLADEIDGISQNVSASGEQQAPASSADLVMQMLAKHGKGLSEDARKKITQAASVAAEVSRDGNVITVNFSQPGQVGDEVRIAHYDVRGAMGAGQVPHDYPEMFQDVRVSPSHLRQLGVQFREHFHLKMITGQGESMAPTIKSRDPLLVDITIREFTGDGIYVLTWQQHFYIKRLQILDEEHYEMISDNPNHGPRTIRMDDTYIQGRVLFVWNGTAV